MNLKTGLLIGTSPKNIGNLFKSSIQIDSLSTLYIKLISNVILESLLMNSKQTFNISKECFRNTVFDYYSQVKNIENVDVRVLLSNFKDGDLHKVTTNKPIDIIYFDSSYSPKSVHAFANKYVENKSNNFQISSYPMIDTECNPNLSEINENQTHFKEYDYVVSGGTFDKLHLGHKLLMSEAVLRCRKRLTVGVCSDLILNNKILPEFIDDCNTRIRGLKDFLHDVEPNIEYNIVPINDVYGPTKEDELLQMIVVSMETIRGAEKINEYRKANGLSVLDVIKINLIDAFKKSDHEENKISSSNRRMRMLGELLKPPSPRPNLSSKPYVIGLTGGIASGKSSVSDYLKTLGCGYVNCDEIGHKIYDIGFPGHHFIVETFGPSVLNDDGSINRKKLGSIVFNDKDKLNILNAGLWPLILKQLKEEIQAFHQNKEVVVVEAALLVKANWTNECHEIWSCIIPPDEATKRLQARNNLSIEDAHKRINSLPSNKEYVAHSNIVFCTLWDKSYTKQQVEKAWYNLKKRVAILD